MEGYKGKVLKTKMVNIDARKADLIARLGAAPGADQVVPVQDRIIIADLIVSGIEKVIDTLDEHLAMSVPVLNSPHAVDAYTMLLLSEAGDAVTGLFHQVGSQHIADLLLLGSPEDMASILTALTGQDMAAKLKEILGA